LKKDEFDPKGLKQFKNIIKKFLAKDPEERLGHSLRGQGARKVKKHPFFKNVDWIKILDFGYEAPYIPNINIEKVKKYLKKEG